MKKNYRTYQQRKLRKKFIQRKRFYAGKSYKKGKSSKLEEDYVKRN